MAYTRVNWEDGELQAAGYVTIDGEQYQVTEATYTGTTPMNSTNLNIMDKGIKDLDNKVNNNDFILATISAHQSISSNSYISFNLKSSYNGNKFTINNGKIKIGAGITKIRVSASVFGVTINSNSYLWGRITKNDSSIATSISSSNNSGFCSASIPTVIVDVAENDLIGLIADTPYTGTARYGKEHTWILVEEI